MYGLMGMGSAAMRSLRVPLRDLALAAAVMWTLWWPVMAAAEGNDEPAAAQIIALGQLETHTVNGADDPGDWFKCFIGESLKIKSLVRCLSAEDAASLRWTLFAHEADGEGIGAMLDGGRVSDRRNSTWFRVPSGWYYLHVDATGAAASDIAYQIGFNAMLLPPEQKLADGRAPLADPAYTNTRINSAFGNVTTSLAKLVRLEAKLEEDALFNFDIEGEYVYFQIHRNDAWQTLPEDGLTFSTHWTDNDGKSRNYLLVTRDILPGSYALRAVYNGSSDYGPSSRQVTLTVETAVSYLQERTAHVVGSGRVPLVLVHGNGGEGADEGHWTVLLDYIRDHPASFDMVDPYVWVHDTERAIGFNGQGGNASEMANLIYNHILPDYPPGTKVILVAHSRGGMVSRSFMGYNTQGDDVAGLITLGTPHHGSPFAVPDWAALAWAIKIGSGGSSQFAFNQLISPTGKGFDIDRLGSVNLAWDNMDSVIAGWAKIAFNINFAVNGEVKASYRDMNAASAFTDETILYSDRCKSEFGTLRTLNQNETRFDKIVTFATYDNSLSDNPNWNNMYDVIVNAVGSLFSDHYGLSGVTRLLAYMADQVAFNSANYHANDGLVPLQSALLLDISGGQPFASLGTGESVSLNWDAINGRRQVKRHRIYTGENLRDHLDLLDTSVAGYWQTLADEIEEFAIDAACLTPPEYNYHIFAGETWSTTAGYNVVHDGCRVYRLYMWDDTAYDFSMCDNDGVGGSGNPGDVDLELFDADGNSLWYIDGNSSCGWDASTIGTQYEEYTPTASGYYYLKVSEYYQEPFTYKLAYKGRIRRGDLQVNLAPADAVVEGAQWRLDGGDWQGTGTTVTGLWIGDYTVRYRPIPGWVAPADESVTIADGQLITLERAYQPDCNGNGIPDDQDLAGGADNCNANAIPDECEPDSDGDGIIDDCDICLGHDDRADADGDGMPDGCDACPGTLPGLDVDAFGCPLSPRADFNRDGDVDLEDFAYVQLCLSGDGIEQTLSACQSADLDGDTDVDGADLALLRGCLSGPGIPADPGCMP